MTSSLSNHEGSTHKVWDNDRKHDFMKLCKRLRDDNSAASVFSFGHKKEIKRLTYDLCNSVIHDGVKLEQAVQLFNDAKDLNKEVLLVLIDVLTVLDIETAEKEKEEKPLRERFIALLAACSKILPAEALKVRMNEDTLEQLNIINKKIFKQKYVRMKTKLFYKQQKFNLLREEMEGYAKLVAELGQDVGHYDHQKIAQNIKALVGCFALDPVRVVDLILEAFECQLHLEDLFVPLLRELAQDRQVLCQLLGFKFQSYAVVSTPCSLYSLAAIMLHHNLVDIDVLYYQLKPDDTVMNNYHKEQLSEAKQLARKTAFSKQNENQSTGKADEESFDQNNQKLGLCEALLKLGNWDLSRKCMDLMPNFMAVGHQPIASTLCHLIHYLIDPLYRSNHGLPTSVFKSKVYPPIGKTMEPVSDFDELADLVFPMLRALGPNLSFDPILLVKICRLGAAFMKEKKKTETKKNALHEGEKVFHGFLSVLDEVILPSLSLNDGNCCLSEEIWSFVKNIHYIHRYRLYGQWKNESYSTHPKLIRTKAHALDRARYIMKRLTKENVKPSGRQIGKLSHANPGILLEYILTQIQTFSALIGPVVDALKYLTALSYDMLAYCVIEALANPLKERMKFDEMNISEWLQSLALFTGLTCKKYPLDLSGLMQYVANQLKAGKSFDMVILREIIQKMGGIETVDEMTDEQLAALSGGELLRAEAGYFAQVRNTKKSSQRLKDTLIDNELALPLALLMCQQRNCVVFQEGSLVRHLKLIGKLYDQCQDTLVQYVSFLSNQLSSEDYSKMLPSFDELITEYHISAEAGFSLSRAAYVHNIAQLYDGFKKQDRKSRDREKDKESQSQLKTQRYLKSVEQVMTPVIESVRPLQPAKIWDDFSPQFYVTFWSLSMYDLQVPAAAYEREIKKMKAAVLAVEENKDMGQIKKKKEKERYTALIDKLNDEQKKQNDHVSRVMQRLKANRDSWFYPKTTRNEMITQFLQLCIFPRCCYTAVDAMYCAKFIQTIHILKTPNFSTLICYDRIFCDITYTIAACTENEANRYGRFLTAMLEVVMRWHSSKEIFDKECTSHPGFVTVFRTAGLGMDGKHDRLDYENYRHVVHKWHFKITKALVICLESGDYVQIRNALIIMTKVLPHYPRVINLAQALERRVERLRASEKDKRPDLYALATSYCGKLKMKSPTFILETGFHLKEAHSKSAKGGGKGEGTKATAKKSEANIEQKSAISNAEFEPSMTNHSGESKDTSVNSLPVQIKKEPVEVLNTSAKSASGTSSAKPISNSSGKSTSTTSGKASLVSVSGKSSSGSGKSRKDESRKEKDRSKRDSKSNSKEKDRPAEKESRHKENSHKVSEKISEKSSSRTSKKSHEREPKGGHAIDKEHKHHKTDSPDSVKSHKSSSVSKDREKQSHSHERKRDHSSDDHQSTEVKRRRDDRHTNTFT